MTSKIDNWTIHHKAVTESTNLDARDGKPGDVFTADEQTAGRGRLDHTWMEVTTLPLVVGLAAATATSLLLLRQTWIKWPNDVLIYHRKLAGILCERHGENVIAGVGINVNQKVFAPEIALRATSLCQVDGTERPLEMVQRAFLKTLAPFYDNWRQNGFAAIHPLIVPCDALKGKQVSVLQTADDATPITGLCCGIQSDGTLLVGDTPVYAGEAHVVSGE